MLILNYFFQPLAHLRANASSAPHLSHLNSEVRRVLGLKRTNDTVEQALSHSLHAKLRWRSGTAGHVMLAAMLLKVRPHGVHTATPA